MMVLMDGVARRLRGFGLTTPILMLTARGGVRDRVQGPAAGADDYLPKQFDLDEVPSRLRAALSLRLLPHRGVRPGRIA